MSRFSKHMGLGEPLVIDGEEFILKPLTTEFVPDFFKAMKAFSGAKEGGSTEEMLKNVDDVGLAAIQRMIESTLKLSFPDEWRTNQDELKAFGLRYMHILISKIFEINTATPQTNEALNKALNDSKSK